MTIGYITPKRIAIVDHRDKPWKPLTTWVVRDKDIEDCFMDMRMLNGKTKPEVIINVSEQELKRIEAGK